MESPAVIVDHVSRAYLSGGEQVRALYDVSAQVKAGSWLSVTGPSGSGKTTLLNIIATLDRPSAGTVCLFGEPVHALRDDAAARLRARTVGLVFQEPHLLPGLTALENVMAPQLPWRPRSSLEREAAELLAAVGLTRRSNSPPARLSGGERQRVAIARALIGGRRLIVADEPTGNLDVESTRGVLLLLSQLRDELGLTLIVATHDPMVAAASDATLRLVGGEVRN